MGEFDMNELGYLAIIGSMVYVVMGIGTAKLNTSNSDLINPVVVTIFWPVALIVAAFVG